ncbi:right-handed parallel beta-helix repeat-containing protein [Limosilactobacillus balticus]|uniref:Right-handed parallel beta-helix repeat-containing protein n=1 Tax=Limosilactobacillus balticus TaxID=2759747 RepID=A0ABS8RC76_9LACO|nr:right-handed parallel beta-helix repeat-containing protein [Limosilactobacillus balticus]MBB1128829.1 right-handed parallel beta-helix repeat-containing protein [Limosilactobacillus balticus]MCD7138065.1 right-handed parallel beta-helix repeat-containing protein [Limosilactobacillus balticus]
MNIYVDKNVPIDGNGQKNHPFKTIQAAANIAQPGDTVLVGPGIYRENVNPQNSGTSSKRITYKSSENLGAVITGAERVTSWEKIDDNVWKVNIPNGVFADYNPYTTKVYGDWFDARIIAHTGEVYLNDKALYEVNSLDEVKKPVRNEKSWYPDDTLYTWFTEQDDRNNETIIYANFQGNNPNKENVEINVRENCFYPQTEGIGYITLSGFGVTKAATQWAPPTAYQEGMIGPHWSKGWIIEKCDISHSKCSGISLGKYLQPNNDNKWSKWKYKDGTQTERDAICQASYEGWDKEHVGSHIVHQNHIHDCGQTGIVGHLGGVFSLIEDNDIHDINVRQNLAGAEIGGIKMHAAIDVTYRHNHIHHCTRGLWLDWQAQGTRVTQNVFDHNSLPNDFKVTKDNLDDVLSGLGEDMWIEVSHGPTLIDNNLLLSDRSVRLAAQGVAFVHNLIAGSFTAIGRGTDNNSVNLPSNRFTPYHEIHGTKVMGFMTIQHGDNKFYNNIFVQQKLRPEMQKLADMKKDEPDDWDDYNFTVGTKPFDNYPTFEEWKKQFDGYCGIYAPNSDHYYNHLPIWSAGNIYFNGAEPCNMEKDAIISDKKIQLKLEQRDEGLFLKTNLFNAVPAKTDGVISTDTIMMAFEPEEKYENPDGTPITFNTDFFGTHREGIKVTAGPFAGAEEIQKSLF